MRIISATEELFANRSKNDLAGAITAGVSAGVVRSVINALYNDFTLWACISWILLGVMAYLTVGILFRHFWRNRILPNWMLTAFFGSMLFILAQAVPGVIKGWYDPYAVHQSFMDYILLELDATKSVVIMLSFVTLPITAIFHYAREIVRATKEWHDGSTPDSILSDE